MKKSLQLLLGLCLSVLTANTLYAQVTPNAEGPVLSRAADFVPSTSSAEALSFYKEGVAAADMGERRKARSLFTKAIEKDPNLGIAYLMRSGTANSTKEWADDINMGRSKMANASEWEKMYSDFVYTDFTGNRDEGIELAKKMAEKFPEISRAQVNLGYSYLNNKQYDLAEAAFKNAISKNPGWVGGYDGLSNIYMFSEKKDLSKAQQNALKVTEINPNRPGPHILLGDTYRAQNKFQNAADEYTKAIGLDANASEGYYKLGHAHVYLGNFDEARKNFKKATSLDERRSFGEMMEATTYAYEGDAKRSMKELIKAADKYARATGDKTVNNAEQLNFLTSAATIASHNGDAKTLRELIPRIEPLSKESISSIGTPEAMKFHEADILNWRAQLAIAEGNYELAKQNAEKIKQVLEPIKDSRKLESYHYIMGLVDLKQKKYKDAITHLDQANMQSIYTKYLLAKAYDGAGDKQKSNEYYTAVANYNFNNVENAVVRYEVKKKVK